MGKNRLPAIDYCKILDDFGENAAIETLNDANEGRIRVETLQKYLYNENETREEYAKRVKKE